MTELAALSQEHTVLNVQSNNALVTVLMHTDTVLNWCVSGTLIQF